jgi:hypothetical protein
MTLAALILFGHLYAPNSTSAYTFPSKSVRKADFGYTMETPEWFKLSLAHTMTTYATTYSSGEPRLSSTRYEIALQYRINRLQFSLEHESWHNADISANTTSYNRFGIELLGGTR